MVDLLQEISFLWLLGLIALGAVFFAVRMRVLTRRTNTEAHADWDYQVAENMQDLRLTKEAYVRAYTKVNAPRKAKYTAMALGAVLIFAIPSFALIQSIVYGIWYVSGQSRVFEPPFLVYQFLVFFATLVFWIFIMSRFIRHFYQGVPGIMRDELAYERAGFTPDAKLVVGPNPAHLNAYIGYEEKTSSIEWAAQGRETYRDIFENAFGLTRSVDENWQGGGHICDIYSDGSAMKIHVHLANGQDQFDPELYPFFYAGEHARHDDKPKMYTIIVRAKNAFTAFEMSKATNIEMSHSSGSDTSRQCNFKTKHMEVYIYDERWS